MNEDELDLINQRLDRLEDRLDNIALDKGLKEIDSALYEQIDKVSKEDTVTGVRSLNLKGDEGAYASG